MEIERKFLVKSIPSLAGVKSAEIKQGYISISPEIRVRRLNEAYFLTKKGEGMIEREEEEHQISQCEGEELFAKIISNLIEKTRYYINVGKYIAELDVYKGTFEGLVIVEVEFETLREAMDFIPPSWFGEDVSENKEYRNKVLALKKVNVNPYL